MTYNGYKNYETWNVALWISNDEGLYHISRGCANYNDFVAIMWDLGSIQTPDNVAWNDSGIDFDEVNEACFPEDVSDEEVDEYA